MKITEEKYGEWIACHGLENPHLIKLSLDEFAELEMRWGIYLIEGLPIDKRKEIVKEQEEKNRSWRKKKEAELMKSYIPRNKTNILRQKEALDKLQDTINTDYSLDWIDPTIHLQEIKSIGFEMFYKKRAAMGIV